jgi:hypothetical protein
MMRQAVPRQVKTTTMSQPSTSPNGLESGFSIIVSVIIPYKDEAFPNTRSRRKVGLMLYNVFLLFI